MGFGALTWLNARTGYYNAHNVQCAKIIQCHQEDRTSLSGCNVGMVKELKRQGFVWLCGVCFFVYYYESTFICRFMLPNSTLGNLCKIKGSKLSRRLLKRMVIGLEADYKSMNIG